MMMRLAQWASLLVALSLLTSAATASAECAWVLWGHGEWPVKGAIRVLPTWQPLDSTKTLDTCTRAQMTWHGDYPDFRYVCLPDTVDPRGPKGK